MFAERDETVVLVAEDDANALSGYLEFLTSSGFVAVGRNDGRAALDLAIETVPDIVLTDITMPGIDGFALAAALRAHPRTRMVPVVGMTAHWNAEMQNDALRAGLSAMIAKPCVPSHMVAEIERVLRRARLMAAVLNSESPKTPSALMPAGLRNAAMKRRTGT
jgi:PleD family two-component response regulator